MILRATISPFVLAGLAIVLVFGVLVPIAEMIRGVSADTGEPVIRRETVDRMVSRSWREAEQCLHRGSGPATGRYVVRATVAASGEVRSAAVIESPNWASAQGACLARIVKTWRFDRARRERTLDIVFDPSQHAYDASAP